MNCDYDIKEYQASIQQMVDLDRQKIVYPITTDEAVVVTSVEESPITLSEYIVNLKNLYQKDILELYERLQGESPQGKAYKAIDGLALESSISTINLNIESINRILQSLPTSEESDNLQSEINNLKEKLLNIEYAINNLEYSHEILLFKVTETINYDSDNHIIHPEEPTIDNNGNFINGWDISYSTEDSIGKYVWMASSIVKIKGSNKQFEPWKVVLLYDNNGTYIGGQEKYEKKIYFRSNTYINNLESPGDDWMFKGWTETPQGVDPENLYEYVSFRYYTINDVPVGEWSKPVLWSRWGSYGRDSSNIEYIYCALPEELSPEDPWPYNDGSNPEDWTNDENFQNAEYIRDQWKNSLWFDNPVGLTSSKPYQYVSIRKRYYYTSIDSYKWDTYSKPVLWSSLGKDGQSGDIIETQGLMGPVIRFRGEWNPPTPDNPYVNMKNDTQNTNDIRYIDVVLYAPNGNYYMVRPVEDSSNSVSSATPPPQDTANWQQAEGFEFIATKALYAENAKIDYLSSNEVVILNRKDGTNEDYKIVAGMTGGNSTIIDTDSNQYGEGNNNVRIWAGTDKKLSYTTDEESDNIIMQPTTIDLQKAPFRVYEDGTLVATKARIEGDIFTNTLSLTGSNIFWYNQNSVKLPPFDQDQHLLAYILLYGNNNECTIQVPDHNYKILYTGMDNNQYSLKETVQLQLKDNNLYTLISNYDNTQDNDSKYQWIVTKTGVYNIVINEAYSSEDVNIVLAGGALDPDKFNLIINSISLQSQNVNNVNIPYIQIKFSFELGSSLSNYTNQDKISILPFKIKVPGLYNNIDEYDYSIISNTSTNYIDHLGPSIEEGGFKYLFCDFMSFNGQYVSVRNTSEYDLNISIGINGDFSTNLQLPNDFINNISIEENGQVQILKH